MNGTTQFQVMNPLNRTIEEGENIIAQMQDASDALEDAIQREREARSRYKDALDAYETAETEELAEAVIMGQQKEGPLGGIAVSGKGYDIVLTKLKNDLRGGVLKHLWVEADRYRRGYELNQVELTQAETRFNALRKIADVKTQVLRASCI
jgi:hypothetical protein